MVSELCGTTSRTMHEIYVVVVNVNRHDLNGCHPLCLSLRPLFALRMAFRECETFFFGTARRNGGMRLRREGRRGIDHDDSNMADKDDAKKVDDVETS
jgi:hypothetical protein